MIFRKKQIDKKKHNKDERGNKDLERGVQNEME